MASIVSKSPGACELRLTPDRVHIEWIEARDDGTTKVHEHEPENAWLLRLKLWMLAPFVGEELL